MSRILFVDDEEMILSGLRRVFFRERDIEVMTCTNGSDALKLLDSFKPDLVVSDMRMPIMDGAEFLERVREKNASIIRVILSGYSQWDVTLGLLVKGTCQWYFSKPWNKQDLVQVIRHLISLHKGLDEYSLLELIATFPEDVFSAHLYIDLLNLLSTNASIDEINDLILSDPGLTIKIIQVANAAVEKESIGSVKHAIVLLGLNAIKNVVLASDLMPENNIHPPISDAIDYLWQKSILYNSNIKTLYEKVLKKNMPSKFDCIGFLLQCGHILLLKSHQEMCLAKSNRDINVLTDVRKMSQLFGVDIEKISSYFINWWALPSEFVEAATYANNPSSPGFLNKEMVYICHIALYFTDLKFQLTPFDLYSDCLEYFGVSEEQLLDLLEEASG